MPIHTPPFVIYAKLVLLGVVLLFDDRNEKVPRVDDRMTSGTLAKLGPGPINCTSFLQFSLWQKFSFFSSRTSQDIPHSHIISWNNPSLTFLTMLLSRSTFILLPFWSISVLALSIPQPVRDMESELVQQKAIVDEQSSSSLPTPTSTINLIAASSAPDFEHRHPSRNGDPYGVSDFGIDPAHITDEQLQSLREAGMIRELDAEERWASPTTPIEASHWLLAGMIGFSPTSILGLCSNCVSSAPQS